MTPSGITRPQWVNSLASERCGRNCNLWTHATNKFHEYFLWNCSLVNAIEHLFMLSSVNGLVLSSNKPLPGPILTQIYVVKGVTEKTWMKFSQVIFKLTHLNDWCLKFSSVDISLDLTDDKLILVQVMAWCHLATSHWANVDRMPGCHMLSLSHSESTVWGLEKSLPCRKAKLFLAFYDNIELDQHWLRLCEGTKPLSKIWLISKLVPFIWRHWFVKRDWKLHL